MGLRRTRKQAHTRRIITVRHRKLLESKGVRELYPNV